MNICDYIKKNNLPHEVLPDGKMKQTGTLYCNYANINSLRGFVQYGYLDLSHNQITSLNGFVQNGPLDLSYNQIDSVDGFVQRGYLDLSYNQITSLKGLKHTAYLDLSFNKIKSLDNFTPCNNTTIYLHGNSVYKIIIRIKQKKVFNTLYCNGKFIFYTNQILSNLYTNNLIV
jgi:hypothetical protein